MDECATRIKNDDEFYLGASGYVRVRAAHSIIFYSYDGQVEMAEYYDHNLLIGGYGIERAGVFTLYYTDQKKSRVEQKFGLRVPRPSVIVDDDFDFHKLYADSAEEWPGQIEVDFTIAGATAYTQYDHVCDAGWWRGGKVVRSREKIAWRLCGCEVICLRGCDCYCADYLSLPQPIAEELAEYLLL